MKIGDLVMPFGPNSTHRGIGVVMNTPRFGVDILSPDGTTGRKVCDVFVNGEVMLFSCVDMRVINEGR